MSESAFSAEEEAILSPLREKHGDILVTEALGKLLVFRPLDAKTFDGFRKDKADKAKASSADERLCCRLLVHPVQASEFEAILDRRPFFSTQIAAMILDNGGGASDEIETEALTLTEAEQAVVDDVDSKFGEHTAMRAYGELLVFRPMNRIVKKQMLAASTSDEQSGVAEKAVNALLAHPDKATASALFARKPALIETIGVRLMKAGGGEAGSELKKR